MPKKMILAGFTIAILTAVIWLFFEAANSIRPPVENWKIVHRADKFEVRALPGILKSYAIYKDGYNLLIDCPEPISPKSIPDVELVLLTHHHRDSVGGVESFLKAKIPVRAPKKSVEWLTAANVTKFWKESIPLRTSKTAYFVHPTGFDGIDCSLEPGQTVEWRGLKIEIHNGAGHSPDHVLFSVDGIRFIGDALTGHGKLWTPFTTDWDHWQDVGLKPATETAELISNSGWKVVFSSRPLTPNPSPAEGEGGQKIQTPNPSPAGGERIREAAFLKSFERFTNHLGDPPAYDFLVPKDQVGSNGSKPWSKVTDSLWITGNTYILKSKESNGILVLDPWDKRCVEQIAKLREAEKLGPVELVMFSHAHFDHFDGTYDLPEKGKYAVWALETVAEPIREPFRFRAPFLDERPIAFDKTFKDGESAKWREYTFKFHHLPGQTHFTSGIETTIDGKRGVFTADNFFHFTQYSGSGGWMGMNRSSPTGYAKSAKKILDLAPEQIWAEHGGPFVFNAEDFKRRVAWGEAAAKACDAVSPSGNHLRDWNPHAVSVEPCRVLTKAGEEVKTTLIANPNIGGVKVKLAGRGVFPDQDFTFANSKDRQAKPFSIRLPKEISPGRHIFAVQPVGPGGEFCDPFFAVDVE